MKLTFTSVVAFFLTFILAGCDEAPKPTPQAPKEPTVEFLKFEADWCGPCKLQTPIVDKLKLEFKQVKFRAVNVDNEPELAAQYQARAIPMMVILVDGVEVERFIGVQDQAVLAPALRNALRPAPPAPKLK